ncbi:hypothetical protein BCR34DRAFT_584596 [Clohesyomyces aquaticus]|uniref:Uncharacterized protein n=1 Tax=Clohesyomyces aquaticus TaxID=1231657 RepID=A0A1Y2A166_9PLEO|nr:hypothetical protein BCR34DRAFT_584596 [Clohesyomyces aquaticus]
MANSPAFLSLDLPSTRMSVDFSTVAKDIDIRTASQPDRNSAPSASNRAPPAPRHINGRRGYSHGSSLPQVHEEAQIQPTISRQNSSKWSWQTLSRTLSNASTASSATTAASSIFSSVRSASTLTSTTSSRSNSRPMTPFIEDGPSLSTLPSSLLEHILSYTLSLPITVYIGPEVDNRHLQLRYHRAGLDYVNLKQVINHSIFLVSHSMRKMAMEVLHRQCHFVIDLHTIYHTNVTSTVNANLKKHQKFWISAPTMAKDTLRSLSKLQIRLPVPSTEAGVRRGRDEKDWMDGSDGKGGGGYRVKSMKKEQDDAVEVQKCVASIVKSIMTPTDVFLEAPALTRSLSTISLRRSRSLKRSMSRGRQRSKSRGSQRSDSVQGYRPGEELDGDFSGERKPLKRLDIVFVKRSPSALVLQEVLGLVREMRSVPVSGFTKYHFELNAETLLWATKRRKRWLGFEPDGNSLLNALQGLTVAEKPVEPLSSPREFKYVGVDKKNGRLNLLDSAMRKSAIILEPPKLEDKDLPPVPVAPIRRKPLPGAGEAPKKRVDSFAFIMEEGLTELGSIGTVNVSTGQVHPPTLEDLQRIAQAIRDGRY